jgi:GNAT superfamily N-acetyltransferase
MSVLIRQITSNQDKKKFIRLLWDIYADDPNWVPPLEMDRLKLIDEKKNPFYAHADVAWFLAERNGMPVGRIAAIVNHNHNAFWHDKTGFFGFFECENNLTTARQLFDAAEAFMKQRGMTSVWGPANPSSNDEMGLLIEGFDRPPVMLMTYNPHYYPALVEQCGYHKIKDLYAWLLSQENSRSPKLERVVKALKERSQITIRSFRKDKFDEEVGHIKRIYNAAWERNWSFVPFTEAEIDFLAKDLKQIYDPDVVLFAEQAGKTIGFSLSLPDINQAFHAGPKIPPGVMNLPIGVWNLMTKKKHIDTLRILVLGVLQEHRRSGVDAMLYWETMERAKKKGYQFGEASWVLEDNVQMNRAAEMMQGSKYKTYRMYEKALSGISPTQTAVQTT